MSTRPFRLFRFYHANGTAKDWAYADLGFGQAEIRWGAADHLVHVQRKHVLEAYRRVTQKTRKGYVFLGTIWLDDQGHRVPT